jgi:hypothetical protein
MSKRLEDFIKANKEGFDEFEPGADLWSRIEKQLPPDAPKKREAKTFSLGFVLRVAASVIVVMGISFVVFYKSVQQGNKVDLAAINPVYAKQQMHYASLVETKRSELKAVAKTNPELYQEFSEEIAQMDSTYKKLNNDLANSPNQEAVLQAMIKNLQIQTDVLSQQLNAIEQYKQAKKEPYNETKDI